MRAFMVFNSEADGSQVNLGFVIDKSRTYGL